MQLEPILWYLQQHNIGPLGQYLFQDFMPGDISNGIVLLQPLGGNRIDWELGTNYRKDDVFQVIARSTTRTGSFSNAKPIQLILTISKPILLPATPVSSPLLVNYIRPTQDPIVYPRQTDQLWECSLNFEATYTIQPSNGGTPIGI